MIQTSSSQAKTLPFLGAVGLDSLSEQFSVESLLRQMEARGTHVPREGVNEYLNDVLLGNCTVRARVPNGDEDLCEIDISETDNIGGGAVVAVANVAVATQVAAVLQVAAVIAQVTMLVAFRSYQ